MIGDVTQNNGMGGVSAFGPKIREEQYICAFDQPYTLAMVNNGSHTTKSAFFVTFDKLQYLSHLYVGFGIVVEGFDVIERLKAVVIEGLEVENVFISDCGLEGALV